MKKITATLTVFLLLTISAFSKTTIPMFKELHIGIDQIIIEVIAKDTTIEAALIAAKKALIKSKFIATTGMQNSSFIATRTTVSCSDYYVADVSATKAEGKVKLTISFIKIGSGLFRLQKMADEVNVELEK